jgi:hypothetical protein
MNIAATGGAGGGGGTMVKADAGTKATALSNNSAPKANLRVQLASWSAHLGRPVVIIPVPDGLTMP